MTAAQNSKIALSSGFAQLTVSQNTGKIAQLCCMDQNLLIEPKQDEWGLGLEPNDSQIFNSSVAWGSDECFPNVAASQVWGLRDHGQIWGQQPEIVHAQFDTCSVVWKQDQLLFKRVVRALSFPERTGEVGAFEFEMTYPSSVPLSGGIEFGNSKAHAVGLYAWHTLFHMLPNDIVTWGTLSDVPDAIQLATGAWRIDELTSRRFAPNGKAVASKFYIDTGKSRAFVTSILSSSRKVRIDVIQDDSLPWLGIWWCHNGWGDGRPHSTIGIEPTNIPSDGPVLKFGSTVSPHPSVAKIMVVINKI